MARPKAVVNDQGELIEAIKNGERRKAWEKVKYIGIREMSDIKNRFILFSSAFAKFDPHRNNNFIGYYKQLIKYEVMSEAEKELYKFTSNRKVINIIKTNSSCPKETEDLPLVVQEISMFMHGNMA